MMNIPNIRIFNSAGRLWIGIFIIAAVAFKGNVAEDVSLKGTFKDHFLIGAAVNKDHLSDENNPEVAIVKKHFNTITAENEMKWERIHPKPDEYDFEPADIIADFGKKNNMFLIGHTLIWHNQTPKWVFKNDVGETADKETLLNRMKEHIQKVAGRYKGVVHGWDVVNEALDEDGKLRQSSWLKIVGEDYIAKAFQFAHEADPEAELYYNDFSLENKPKREGAIKIVKDLQSQGIKIDAVGLQGHYKMDWPTPVQLDSTIKEFASLGIKVMITELDIDVLPYKDISAEITLNMEMQEKYNPYKDGLPDSAHAALAQRYRELFRVFVENKNSVDRVTFWGVTDKDSWLNYWPIPGRKSYPLLFDREGEPKRAFNAVIETVKND